MEITQETQGAITILLPKGRLDAHTAPEFENYVLEKIEGGVHKLLLEASDLDYLSSAGLRVLLSATKKIRSLQGSIALASLQPQLAEIIQLAGFDTLIPIYPDREAALAALA